MIKCKVFGHDWARGFEKDFCSRCGESRDNPRTINDDDPNAERGEIRIEVEEDREWTEITTMEYRATAYGPDDEYWQWFPKQRLRVPNEKVPGLYDDLREHIAETL